ncbi:unnamed protein product [Caenorhabditis bovis]|uniref:Uncharacterized protein n=1 Tax=Caenorhabditis bovis TaxID=2654633 RepID=A0A8S1EIM2_9PELO|nr:unnamed protein product [Caenorhabditis bovis]
MGGKQSKKPQPLPEPYDFREIPPDSPSPSEMTYYEKGVSVLQRENYLSLFLMDRKFYHRPIFGKPITERISNEAPLEFAPSPPPPLPLSPPPPFLSKNAEVIKNATTSFDS